MLVALFLQACYSSAGYELVLGLTRYALLAGEADACLTAFSTSSSTVAMLITFEALQEKIGLRASSASLGALSWHKFQ